MPIVKILNRDYQIACGDGEEKKLLELANKLDRRLKENSRIFKGASESMLIIMTALTLEDNIQDLEQQNKSSTIKSYDKELEEISNRIDQIYNKLESK
jgi:cell division protein ZapA (FtsZ GTPase activity inhibitor)